MRLKASPALKGLKWLFYVAKMTFYVVKITLYVVRMHFIWPDDFFRA